MITDHHPYRVVWSNNLRASIISVSCTPNASALIAGAVDKNASTYSSSGNLRHPHGFDHEVWATSIAADGSRIAIGTAEKKPARGSLTILDGSGNPLWRYNFPAPIWSVSLSSNGERCLAGCWDGNVYAFTDFDGSWKSVGKVKLGEAGVYGVSLSDDGNIGVAAAYDYGLYVLRWPVIIEKKVAIPEAGYHTAINHDGTLCVLGLRDGSAAVVNIPTGTFETTQKFTKRPICGTAVSGNGAILALGSFDGNVYLASREGGRRLWTFRTDGEVWDVALTKDGRFLLIGSGDGKLTFVENFIANAALLELQAVEQRVSHKQKLHDRKLACDELVTVCLRYRLIEYAQDRILELQRDGILDETLAAEAIDSLFEKSIKEGIAIHSGSFHLAERYEARSEWWQAALHYLDASGAGDLKVQALFRAGFCFTKAGHNAAAQSCFRRSREFEINDVQKRVLYLLARDYEDDRAYPAARDIYDVLLTLDRSYRDVEFRLNELDTGLKTNTRGRLAEIDYTGKTVKLTGPDAPKADDVDVSLKRIPEARSKELYISPTERAAFFTALREYSTQTVASAIPPQLKYDLAAYIKYDHAPPEDELKKRLELINVKAILQQYPTDVARSLDIGAATGRYPGIFAKLGIEAIGMDREPAAMEYAQGNAVQNDTGYPKFVVAEAQKIPFPNESFDLVTCMMGTFSHMGTDEQKTACAEVHRILRPGGMLIISTWDVHCSHLSFLSMYTQDEKQRILSLSPSQIDASLLLSSHGFEILATRPFALIPDVFSYELGLQELGTKQIDSLIHIDLAVRDIYPDSHGQMYLVAGRKPPIVARSD